MERRWFVRMSAGLLAGCAALLAVGPVGAQGGGPVVAVTGGRIEGQQAAGGAIFKGIPFAAAPVGELRWREPQPVKAWAGVRPARDYGAACMQPDNGWNKLAASRASEDCLFLNVWTPAWPAKARMPVMVWIHGGGNSGGSAMGAGGIEPPFDGASLARKGVLVVTINYRLGLFGFMGHPEATAESPHHASGGYGLLDQIAALRWVRDNITRFGGDPANVTVFGQSAGAQDLTLLVASPLTRGLISKAIVQSGSPMIGDRKLTTPAQTAELGMVLAKTMNAPATGSLTYLRSLPADKLLAALPDFRKNLAAANLNMDVGMDGYAVPEFTPSAYQAGRQAHIPMIVGNMAQDTPGYRPQADKAAAVRQRVDAVYGQYPELKTRALAFYGVEGGGAAPGDAKYGPLDMQVAVDHGFRCQATIVARWQAAVAPTWSYEFSAGQPNHPPLHSGELDFVFGYLRDQAGTPLLRELSEQVQRYWTNFARTGDPNGAGLPRWPAYGSAHAYLELGNDGPQPQVDLRGGICNLYAEKLDRDLRARNGS